MKHLRLFENIESEDKLKRIVEEYSELLDLMREYLALHKDQLDNELVDKIEEIWFPDPMPTYQNRKVKGTPLCVINYTTTDGEGGTYAFFKKNYDDFLSFINDPVFYKATKNYNL